MASQTRIQLRRGYSTGYTGVMIGGIPTGISGVWVDQILAPGEIGFELNTGKFKIGTDGLTTWSNLPYAGGSLLSPGSGVSLIKNDTSNTYTLYSTILSSGNGLTASTGVFSGNGTTTASGSYYSIGLAERLQNLSNITSTGIIIATGTSGVVTRSLASGNNIFISNANGSSGDPTVSLSTSLTGITNISGVNNFSINSNSGISINAGSGTVTIDDLTVSNELNIGGNINISLAAAILATGPVAFSGNPVLISGTTYFNTTPYVGPTGGGAVPVSLSGHNHSWTDVTNFCTGVASCIDTSLTVSTGLRADYTTNNLQLALSGQAANLHTLTGTGFVARTGGANNEGSFIARSVTSGSNIDVINGNGVNGNPTVSLASAVTGLTSLEATTLNANTLTPRAGQTTLNLGGASVSITGDLTVGNLSVTGTTTTVNSTTITIQDPVITVGGTGTLTAADAAFDRGIQLRYWGGAPATGFMGWNSTSSEFIFLSSTTGTLTGNDYGAGTFGNARFGNLGSLGSVSGNAIFATGQTGNQLAIFDSNKQIVSTGFPTLTQLSYVSGVSSNIQTQIDSKASSGVSLTAGNGLTGGGSLSGNLSFNIGAGDGITVNADDIAVNSTVVRTTGAQTISGIKTFAELAIVSGIRVSGETANRLAVFDTNRNIVATGSSTTFTEIGYLSNVTGAIQTQLNNKAASGIALSAGNGLTGGGSLSGDLVFDVGQGDGISVSANAIAVDSTVIRTTGVQTISAVKTFTAAPVFSGGLVSSGTVNMQLSASSNAGTYFPVFTGIPTTTGQSLLVRDTGQLRSDLSINNVTNDAQVKKRASSTNGYVPTWNGTTGDSLNDGWLATSGNTFSSLVLRDSTNGGFTAGTITATGFVGNGSSITGLNASNLASGTVPTGLLSGTYNISITGSAYSTTGSLTFKNDGTGDAANVAFSGLVSRTISYNTIGAPSTTGANASGSNWNIGILGNAATVTSGVYTSGNQNIYGLKTFYDRPIFNSGLISSGTLNVQSAASTTPVGFAVFDTAPTATGQSLLYRTVSSVRSDLGSSTNTASTLVLRDANGNFSAGSITGTSFIGSGNLLTDVNAYNLSIYSNTNTDTITSLVLVTGNSTGNYRPFIDSRLYFNANSNTLMLENISGLLTGSYLSSSLNIIGATSISGTQGSTGNPVSQLLNFIVDGGTP